MGTRVKVETTGMDKLFQGKFYGSRRPPQDGQEKRAPNKAAEKCERGRHTGQSWGSNAIERLSRTMTKTLLALVILNESVGALGN